MVVTSPLHLNSSATLVRATLWRRGDSCVRWSGKTSQTLGSSATTQSWQPTMFASDAPLHVWHNGTAASWACCSLAISWWLWIATSTTDALDDDNYHYYSEHFYISKEWPVGFFISKERKQFWRIINGKDTSPREVHRCIATALLTLAHTCFVLAGTGTSGYFLGWNSLRHQL